MNRQKTIGLDRSLSSQEGKQLVRSLAARHREMRVKMPHPTAREQRFELVANPYPLFSCIRRYTSSIGKASPKLGEYIGEVLQESLQLGEPERTRLRTDMRFEQRKRGCGAGVTSYSR